ncbi:hypothetical protein DFH09DRAFT_1301030 [Mycena vulgaris]|nr:hypothetical protein DFH09DRAFT_1301030 [Mycena vulgaris]
MSSGVHVVSCTGLDVFASAVILTTGFIVNTRLDAKILESTLSTLIERKFPRAGARLARRNGAYEFQIPKTFDINTPPVAFTAEDYTEHYQSSSRPELPIHLPHHSEATEPFIQPVPALEVYFKSKRCPVSLDELLVPSTPLLHVHVATFDDVTFIGTRLINGEALDAIPGMEWGVEPFCGFPEPPTDRLPRGWFDFGLLGRLLFIVRLGLRTLRDPTEAAHLVRIPKAFIAHSKREIMEELRLKGSNEWVGSSDVLTAWWLKTAYSHRRSGDSTPIHIYLAIDLRDKPVFPGASTIGSPYINNAVMLIQLAPIPANAFRAKSLAELALSIRRAIITYLADPAGIAADLNWRCTNPRYKRETKTKTRQRSAQSLGSIGHQAKVVTHSDIPAYFRSPERADVQ